MSVELRLDELDLVILKILIEDARSSLKNIAKRCGLTSSAVHRRIERLKREGVIVGTRFVTDAEAFGYPLYATLLMDAADSLEPQIKETVRAMENVIICAESIGRYNLCTLIHGRDIQELNSVTSIIKNIKGINRVAINIWSGEPYFNYAKTLEQVNVTKVDNNGRC
jgi:Lrp/AsnC family transcriptional regulator, regulator for asnA, asnC and gidA